MRQNVLSGFVVLLGGLGLALTSGCTDMQIGRQCNNLGKTPTTGVAFVNPAPDCPTRLCMVTPPPSAVVPGATGHDTTLSICTAECETDADCEAASEFTDKSRCTKQKFVCAVPSVVPGGENFCCKKLCVCQDDLIPGSNTDGTGVAKLPRDSFGVAIPSACQDSRRAKTCSVTK